MTAIGKIYGDAGLQDLLIESGISTEKRIEQALHGKRYNNACSAIYVFTKVYTVLRSTHLKIGLPRKENNKIFETLPSQMMLVILLENRTKEIWVMF